MHAPIVSLEAVADDLEGADVSTVSGLPDIGVLRSSSDIAAVLDAAGDERFLAKSHGFTLDISQAGPDEAPYLGIMDALGYASNRKPFRMLAQLVPYATLVHFRDEPPSTRPHAIKALLLGASGLMHRVGDAEGAAQLRRLYRRMPKHLPKPKRPLTEKDWKLFRVRPSNHPTRRVIGAAYIVDACLDDGIAETFASALSRGGAKALIACIEHRPYIGKGRARDMLINIALPFLHAYATERGSGELADAAQAAYAAAPKLQENEITREMRRLCKIGREVKMTARRQQGLIHLYRTSVERQHV